MGNKCTSSWFLVRGSWLKNVLFTLLLSTIYHLPSTHSPVYAQTTGDWYTAGANYSRTNWTPTEVRGTLAVEWFRAIEPIVSTNAQIITADGKLFLSTARGLYAFNAANGTQLWVYATQLPLASSPTYANGYLYIGGLDKRMYAISATTGQLKSGWTFSDQIHGGFETSAVVADGKIYATNRDGRLYCLDAGTGAFLWEWTDTTDEWPDAPLRHTPAFKNGVLYFGSDNGHAYAVTSAGVTKYKWGSDSAWAGGVNKPNPLPGVGFSSNWPVIYTEKATGKDWVLFSGSKKEVGWVWFGNSYFQENYDIFSGIPLNGLIGSLGNVAGDWISGTTTIDNTKTRQYLTNNPHKRHLFVFDTTNGAELTPYAPVTWVGATHGGSSKQQPIVGSDGVIYTQIGYRNSMAQDTGYVLPNAGAAGAVAGWKFGSQYISRIHDVGPNRGVADEGIRFSAGGNMIYWAEGYNMGYGAIDYKNTNLTTNYTYYANCGIRWGCLGQEVLSAFNVKRTCNAANGICNGVYGGESSVFIPYQNKLYFLEGNVLMALSNIGGNRQLASVPAASPNAPSPIAPSAQSISSKLETEVSKIISSGGVLRPGFHDSGLWGTAAFNNGEGPVGGDHLDEYFFNPTDTVTTLIKALPYLNATLAGQVRTYIQTYYGPGKPNDFTKFATIGWKNGGRREIYPDMPERAQIINQPDDINRFVATDQRQLTHSPELPDFPMWKFPPTAFYAGWMYAKEFGGAADILTRLETNTQQGTYYKDGPKLTCPLTLESNHPAYFRQYPFMLNAYLTGYKGLLELEKLAGRTTTLSGARCSGTSSIQQTYDLLKTKRISEFSKDGYFSSGYEHNMNIAGNFLHLAPEVFADLTTNTGFLAAIREALDNDYTVSAPYWFIPKLDRSSGEVGFHHLYEYPALFQAKTYGLGNTFTQLSPFIDQPAFWRGDLYYIQNLTAALSKAGNIPSPTPTQPSSTKPGDANGDNLVDGRDYVIWAGNYNKSVQGLAFGDFDNNSIVDGRDYVIWMTNYGT